MNLVLDRAKNMHCDICDVCFPTESKHTCAPGRLHSDCAICQVRSFFLYFDTRSSGSLGERCACVRDEVWSYASYRMSPKSLQVCNVPAHNIWLLRHGGFQCPLCKRTLLTDEAAHERWAQVRRSIESTIIAPELVPDKSSCVFVDIFKTTA